MENKTPNNLIHEKSPYLLQHAYNPVNWYPWGKEAFDKAKEEDKPVFLSIGYSTCHWCHVMAHESFEDQETADILNKYFISIKVDKEQRPDIDSVYMAVCQAFTGSGGWPTSIFMTADQKPFFAGTYFPKISSLGMVGFKDLLTIVQEKWETDRKALLKSADEVTQMFNKAQSASSQTDEQIIKTAVDIFSGSYDERYGGFGEAPKFPSPHNLLFLLQQYEKFGDSHVLKMVENTLTKMYLGGMFDHIGYGFCRYSTDRYFLVPHFEKMLYDNALLILAYCKTYELTKKEFFKSVAEKIAFYIMTEMTSEDGGFYSAQDADSDGVEGKYYVFKPNEIISVLGEKDGDAFSKHYDITSAGNFEGSCIPNLLRTSDLSDSFAAFLPKLREYRKSRCKLHTDDKILTSWNSLMIAALCSLYRISKNENYLKAAIKAQNFIKNNLYQNDTLYVSFRDGEKSEKGFLSDYAFYAFSLIRLYEATLQKELLLEANKIISKAKTDFYDDENGGFYLAGKENESLIINTKETYDGAIPSGNSMMAYDLLRMNFLEQSEGSEQIIENQLRFMQSEAEGYPAGYAMYLMALSDHFYPPKMITVVLKDKEDIKDLPFTVPQSSIIKVLENETSEYKLINNKTTYYVCNDRACLPPSNKPDF